MEKKWHHMLKYFFPTVKKSWWLTIKCLWQSKKFFQLKRRISVACFHSLPPISQPSPAQNSDRLNLWGPAINRRVARGLWWVPTRGCTGDVCRKMESVSD